MNYIDDLMNKSGIKLHDYFGLKGCSKYSEEIKIFYFDSYYRLRSRYGETTHDSIFVKLMTGEYTINK